MSIQDEVHDRVGTATEYSDEVVAEAAEVSVDVAESTKETATAWYVRLGSATRSGFSRATDAAVGAAQFVGSHVVSGTKRGFNRARSLTATALSTLGGAMKNTAKKAKGHENKLLALTLLAGAIIVLAHVVDTDN